MSQSIAQSLVLPQGVVLAKDESVRSYGEFLVSNVWVFLKLKLVLTTKRLAGEKPNTFLGFIPVGSDKVSYPLSNIAGVNTSTRISPLALIVGAIFLLAGIATGVQNGWFAMLIGVVLLLGSYQAQLNVQNSGGFTIRHRISVFNKGAAQTFAQEINTMIAERS
ncbi:MAG: hypothetical protein E6J20_00685 [Chloroflexi bacterium]|nr:MAG: hypothetical protein E6J20_00685 [Chloroflexota bacterium]